MKIIERSELRPLISPHRNQYIGIHNWHSYKHSYSKEVVENLVSHFDLTRGSWVLDPFCGGATLLTCRDLGVNSEGFDILPFAVFLTNVKLEDYDYKELQKK